jgi:PAS domain S-box-containing protein
MSVKSALPEDEPEKREIERLREELARARQEVEEGRAALKRLEAQAVHNLRRSEAYLKEAQRLSRTGSFGYNVHTGEIIWSEETFAIFGYAPTTAPSLELVLSRVHPDDLESVKTHIQRSLREGSDANYEHRIVMPDGFVKSLQVLARATQTPSNETELVGVVMDVTERKRTADALRISEHLVRSQLQAVTTSLAALSREPEPEKFLEHIFRVTCQQLGAASSSIWEVNDTVDCVDLAAIYENDRLQLPMLQTGQAPRLKYQTDPHPVWDDFFRNGRNCVFGTIEPGPPWSRVAVHQDGPWHDWRASMVDNPLIPKMHVEISASGVVATLNAPMFVSEKVTGLFVLCFKQHRRFQDDEIELARAMSHQAMLAMQLMRLSRQSRETAVIAERNRMAREIHDTLAQGFTGVIVQLEVAKGAALRSDLNRAASHIDEAGKLARASLGEARRSVRALRPQPLRDATLPEAISDLLKKMSDSTGLKTEFQVQGDGAHLPVGADEELLRITQEALTNTIKHAQAKRFRASLSLLPEKVELCLGDDGQGFDPDAETEGFGLVGMRERADRLSGSFALRTTPSLGTEITVSLPVHTTAHKSR